MAKTSAKDAIILVGGYNFSTYVTQYDGQNDAGKVDVTGFGDRTVNFIPSLPTSSFSANMLWDSAANKVHAALASMPSGKHFTLLPEGYALGNQSISLPFMLENYNPGGAPADALGVGTLKFASYGNNEGLELGWVLAHATITNTTTGTGFDDPTSGAVTARCAGTLHVWGLSGADTYVVKIQHSTALGSGYVDLITFTLDGSALNSERIAVASGTINRYRRVVATRTGSEGNTFGYSVHFWHA